MIGALAHLSQMTPTILECAWSWLGGMPSSLPLEKDLSLNLHVSS